MSSDGLISSLSNTAEQLTGYSAHELVGRPVTMILADRSIFEVPQMMRAAVDWGAWNGEIMHRNRSGKAFKAGGKPDAAHQPREQLGRIPPALGSPGKVLGQMLPTPLICEVSDYCAKPPTS